MWTLLALLIVVGLVLATAEILIHRAQPILKARVIDTLSTRFDSSVQLKTFHVSVLRGLEVSGGGLALYPHELPQSVPLLSIQQFSFHTGWWNLLRTPMYIDTVQVRGLEMHLPPASQRGNVQPSPAARPEQHDRQHRIKINAGRIEIEEAVLTLGTSKPGKLPLTFNISHIELASVAEGKAMQYRASLVNPRPRGDIVCSGHFGPFQLEQPGDTPLDGRYTFSHANLSDFRGIGGILSSTGTFHGTLNNLTADGETDTPDFRLSSGNHPMPLHTRFHALIDGTNGDTYLQPVDAMLAGSHIVASGKVVRDPAAHGRIIHLDVTAGPANIRDFLQLAVKTQPPLMSGQLHLHTSFDLAPGAGTIPRRMRMAGNFSIADAHFSNPKWQAAIAELSLRSQGKMDQARSLADARKQGVPVSFPEVASQMRDGFRLAAGRFTFDHLTYEVPGAEIALDGVYSLDGRQFDLHGAVATQARASQMVTGWKSLMLKAVDPFLAKHGAGMEIPISITGTRSDPHFGLDFHNRKQDERLLPPGHTPPK